MTMQERLRRSNLIMLVVPIVIAGVLLAAVVFTNLYLTKALFVHIEQPLAALVQGAAH